MEDWMLDNMHGILVAIEVLWVSGFLAVFVLYFVIRHKIKKSKAKQEQNSPPDAPH